MAAVSSSTRSQNPQGWTVHITVTAPAAPARTPGRPTPLAVSVVEAGRLLGVGRTLAYELVHTGRLRSVVLGHRVVVPMASVLELLAESTEPASRPFGPSSR